MRRRDFLTSILGVAASTRAAAAWAQKLECQPTGGTGPCACSAVAGGAQTEAAFWSEQRAQLRKLLAAGDRERFLHWPPIVNTMFFSPPPDELRWLQSLPNWPGIRDLLVDPGVGGADLDAQLQTNGNIVHHAYSLFRFESDMGQQLPTSGRILEIGGGYGNFCRLVLRRGFRGEYVIYDLPEVLELQEWYLRRTLSPEQVKQVTFATALPGGADTIVGLWSISEMPLALRECIKAFTPRQFLIGYQDDFYGLDNVAYFKGWTANPAYRWVNVAIPHIRNNFYLFGVRR